MTSPPRSFLFTPASRPDRFLKAAATEADALILDLEDAVAESDKIQARANVVAFLTERPHIRQHIVVRINPIGRVCGLEDLAALAGLMSAPDCLLIPKVEDPAHIAAVSRVLEDAGSSSAIAGLIESARGIVRAPEVAQADQRLSFLMFGAADYAADLGQDVGSFRPDHARAALVNAAAAGGIVAIDSPFFAINQPDELLCSCSDGRASGFHGKAAIHPSQIDAINGAYRPSDTERERARQILAAAPEGVGIVDGKMVDIAMVRWAKRVA